MASSTGSIVVGALVAASSPAWAGRSAPRAKVDWIPPAHVPPLMPNGKWNPVWYRFFHEIAEIRLGGVQGSTVAQIETSVSQTQTEVAATTTYAQSVATYAQGIAATATATAEVAQNNSLSGAGSIPSPPEPPPPPGGYAV